MLACFDKTAWISYLHLGWKKRMKSLSRYSQPFISVITDYCQHTEAELTHFLLSDNLLLDQSPGSPDPPSLSLSVNIDWGGHIACRERAQSITPSVYLLEQTIWILAQCTELHPVLMLPVCITKSIIFSRHGNTKRDGFCYQADLTSHNKLCLFVTLVSWPACLNFRTEIMHFTAPFCTNKLFEMMFNEQHVCFSSGSSSAV